MSFLVNETSRLSQLTPAGIEKFGKLMADNGLLFSALQKDMFDTIDAMDGELYSSAINWYVEANGYAYELAGTYDVSVPVASAVISAVSPRMGWLRNKSVARDILATFRNYSDDLTAVEVAAQLGLGMYANVGMAVKIARGEEIAEVLSGTKRRSFYNNIVSPTHGDSVTVDTWMVRSIMRTTGKSLADATKFLTASKTALGGTGFGYYAIAESVRTVADRMNLFPSQVQAAYWVAVSGSQDGGFPSN